MTVLHQLKKILKRFNRCVVCGLVDGIGVELQYAKSPATGQWLEICYNSIRKNRFSKNDGISENPKRFQVYPLNKVMVIVSNIESVVDSRSQSQEWSLLL